MRHGRVPFILGFLVAPVTLYSYFVLWPYVQTINLTFYQWRGFTKKRWVGLENYDRMLHADRFYQALEHHAVILVFLPLATIAFALFFAFLLNVGGKGRGGKTAGVWGSSFYRVVFFLPQVLAVPVIGVLFATVYRPNESGLINGVLLKAGLDKPIGFLIEKNLALPALIAVLVWQAVGFYVVLFSAGMAAIPKDYFEAAALDGAGRARLFFSITLPLLRDTIQVGWVYLGIAAFDGFALILVLAGDKGEPDGATTVLPVEIWKTAFTYSKVGYASAMGVVLFFLTVTFAVLTLRTTRRERIEL